MKEKGCSKNLKTYTTPTMVGEIPAIQHSIKPLELTPSIIRKVQIQER